VPEEDIILFGLEFSQLITISSLGVAFAALFIAPFFNSQNSKRQVIAPMRQAWINTLRDKISEALAIMSVNRLNYCPSSHWDEERKERAEKRDLENYEQLMLLIASINLYINPDEPEHVKLIKLLESAVTDYHNAVVTDEKQANIIILSQQILKKEWEVTKKT